MARGGARVGAGRKSGSKNRPSAAGGPSLSWYLEKKARDPVWYQRQLTLRAAERLRKPVKDSGGTFKEFVCLGCATLFRRRGGLRGRKPQWCSAACYRSHSPLARPRQTSPIACLHCGEAFTTSLYKVAEQRFCSATCANLYRSPLNGMGPAERAERANALLRARRAADPETARRQERMKVKRNVDGITDLYIRDLMRHNGIRNPPLALIEAKRAHIRLKRAIKERQQ